MAILRPFELARRQVDIDRENMRRLPVLIGRKRDRMLASPHVLLRGTAPLFYEILAAAPDLANGPEGEGWIAGDMHLENMGAFRDEGGSVIFDLNDFDDATIGPWRLDVLRLLTSLVLGARAFGIRAKDCVELTERLLGAYVAAVFYAHTSTPPKMAEAMEAILEAASKRKKTELLDARTIVEKGKRRFIRGERYLDLSNDLEALVKRLLPAYIAALGDRAPGKAKSWVIEDAAIRIAGTGSLGRLRFGIIAQDGAGDERILDFKEAAPPSYLRFSHGSEEPTRAAERVVDAARALLGTTPRLLAPISAPEMGMSFIGRQLSPQEDKLDVAGLKQGKGLKEIGERVGFLLGTAHLRAAKSVPEHPWSERGLSGLIDAALELAGLFEAIYLAYSRMPL
jgi:uncharacterized protein (DUF2252 family)